ncbi:sulfate ABC transporter permease subunit CysT [Phenylobacterium sp.]|uniref:sulfate ABC transporter permease subunit CysT n=1 Tax=Phenylobacterium sp. TaxID=1871053 RepID=UPI002731F5CA|nr:sulfate ABC transporter permease subunit CysT [Phenylobacterium sp.]MDP1618758.1 sulfate ABC transporter permease subunit CysT [Phenylobacterium sp.]MDP1986932.1 sulfate ABC transporter permease subunit CysT [Phenylobacterium sp.]
MTPSLALARAPRARRSWRKASVLPGFPLALGVTLTWLSLIFLIPLSALILRPWELGPAGIWAVVTDPRVLAALRISFGSAALAALVNAGLGLLIAWVLVRHPFPGRRLVDALVDLPFALPTAVAGIALTAIYAPNGPLGQPLSALGIQVAYTPLGIILALIFVGLPFVVRTVQPVLEDLSKDVEEAALTLGATPPQTAWRVVMPAVAPALLTGVGLAFARAAGEYGSVIFIAGNMPLRSEIAPLLIVIKLEQFDYAGAAAVGLAMLVLSFTGLLILNSVQGVLASRGRA